jgi:uncharacterized protein with FMN-binding domain
MPKRGVAALFITTGALVLLLSFKTPDETLPARGGGIAVVEPSSGPPTTTNASRPATRASTPPASGATPSPGTTGTTGGSTAKTVDGPVVSTQFGPIQVEVVLAGGHIQDVVALQLPTGRRSGQISNFSAPILRTEALQAQSASIDAVSGATYTSYAYAQSLQAALDQAGHG